MKKLYRKGTVHPSPPIVSDHLSFLPATVLTLAAALSPEDREVLAYLISCSSNSHGNFPGQRKGAQKSTCHGKAPAASSSGGDHPPSFNCDCFRCYMSYWVRWDSSPNRQLIHEIIDAIEDGLPQSKGVKNSKKERKKRGAKYVGSGETKPSEISDRREEPGESESVEETCTSGGGGEDGDGEEAAEKGSVRRFVSFIGERIWGAWGQNKVERK